MSATLDDNVVQLPSTLDRLGCRIDQAWQRARKGETEWIEGSLELAETLAQAKEQFPAYQDFGRWIKSNGHDHVNEHDRTALIGFASDLKLARKVLTETTRRSYRLIWEEVKNRFGSAAKTDAPKLSRRPKKAKKPKSPEKKDRDEKIIDLSDTGKTTSEIAPEVGLARRSVQDIIQDEEIRREAQEELLDAAAAENFNDKGKLKIEDAIRIHKTRLEKQFEQRVNEEVLRRIAAADDAARASNKKLNQENIGLRRIIQERGVFTESQFKQVLMLCHPDNSASPELKSELLQILIKNKIRLIKD